MRKTCPHAKLTVLEGNHDNAVLRMLSSTAPSMVVGFWERFARDLDFERLGGVARREPHGRRGGLHERSLAGMLAHATARGRTQPIQRAAEIVALWVSNAYAANKIPVADWPSFRDLLLAAVDLETALESMD